MWLRDFESDAKDDIVDMGILDEQEFEEYFGRLSNCREFATETKEGENPLHAHIVHLLHQYGYVGVLFIFLAEMIGAPFPAETTLTLCGFEWGQGIFLFLPLWLMATIGNVCGSTISYAIGFHFGYPLIHKYGRFIRLSPERLVTVQDKFEKRRVIIVLFGKFLSGVRVFTPFVAGMNRMQFSSFSFYNSISALGWAAFYILEGRYFDYLWTRYPILHHTIVFVMSMIGVVLLVVVVKWFIRKNH